MKKMDYLVPTLADNLSLNLIKSGNKELGFLTGGYAYYSLESASKKNGLALSNASWNVSSTVLGTLSGNLIWNEKLTTKKIIGLSLGILALYLMNGS